MDDTCIYLDTAFLATLENSRQEEGIFLGYSLLERKSCTGQTRHGLRSSFSQGEAEPGGPSKQASKQRCAAPSLA